MTVTAAAMPGPNEPIELREFADPVLEDGSVVLQTIASEVCGTDVHLQQGRLDGVPYPIIPGHVSVGRIIEMRNVTQDALGNELAIGDTVTFYDVHEICHSCYHCTIARIIGTVMVAGSVQLAKWSGASPAPHPNPAWVDALLYAYCALGFAAMIWLSWKHRIPRFSGD